MYKVPMKKPTKCNKYHFGHCTYSFPLGGSGISRTDGKQCKPGTYGYICNLDFDANGEYTKVMRAKIDNDIRAPKWCGLQEDS